MKSAELFDAEYIAYNSEGEVVYMKRAEHFLRNNKIISTNEGFTSSRGNAFLLI